MAQQKDQMRRDSIKFVRELPKRIKEAYINKVEAYYNQSGNFEHGYFLYDLTKDGIPELWVVSGNGASDGRLNVFTYFNEDIISIFENNLGYSYFYKGKGYILQVVEDMYESNGIKLNIMVKVLKRNKCMRKKHTMSMVLSIRLLLCRMLRYTRCLIPLRY